VLSAGSEPSDYAQALVRQMQHAQDIMSGLGLGDARFRLIEARDPAELEQAVWDAARPRTLSPATFNLSNDKRATLDFVFAHLLQHAPARKESVALAADAPYGAVVVDKQKCTLCLACVGACPEGALLDAKDKPQLKFIERNCVQCGLCEKTCPKAPSRSCSACC
jgi:ferredoxin